MITYTWSISKLDCAPLENGLTNVVKTIYWGLTGTDENGVSASMSNSYPLSSPSPEGFADYLTLTEEDVIVWLESNLDVGYIKTKLSNEIASQYNPPITSLPFPWIKVEEPVIVEATEEVVVTEEPIAEEVVVTEEPVVVKATEESVVEEVAVEATEKSVVVQEPAA